MSVFIINAMAVILASVSSSTPPPEPTKNPVVVELFTSQGCSSCPPAEAYFLELAAKPDLVVLEWHVDYWDQLNHGRSGKWKDPFSNPAHSARQRAYNNTLRGRPSAYTPQAVINGVSETVGSRRSEIRNRIKRQTPVSLIKTSVAADTIRFSVDASAIESRAGLEALFVTFQKRAATDVGGGENHGKKLHSANIVTQFQVLDSISKDGLGYAVTPPAKGYGCALLLQEENGGPIHAASYCPS